MDTDLTSAASTIDEIDRRIRTRMGGGLTGDDLAALDRLAETTGRLAETIGRATREARS